jgi:hypothetical protein
MYGYGALKPVEVIFKMWRGKRKNKGGNESNQGTWYAYMEMSQRNFLYKYYILIKIF